MIHIYQVGPGPVLAVKVGEPRLFVVGGVPLDSLGKIAEELQGVSNHPCSKFLAPGIQLEDGETEISAANRKSSRAHLFPLKVSEIKQSLLFFISSAKIFLPSKQTLVHFHA